MTTLKQTLRIFLRAARNGLAELRFGLQLAWDRGDRSTGEAVPMTAGAYLITTDRGLFLLGQGRLQRVSRLPAFGIAIVENDIYLATWSGMETKVVAAGRTDVVSNRRRSWSILWVQAIGNFASRLHQIGVSGDSLWLANTAQNCITRINRHNGKWLASVAPFACSFDHPIMADHSHINSVLATGSFVLFTAFKINRQGAIGVFGNGRLRVFRYCNMGIHDCVIDHEDILVSDSFGFWDKRGHGYLTVNGAPALVEAFQNVEAKFVRGIAGHDQELLVGVSNSGSRDTRFSARGALLHFPNKSDASIYTAISIPAAQVYDIVRLDGTHVNRPAAFRSADELSDRLETLFGEPVIDVPLDEALVGEITKNFDQRDIGDVREYL